MTQRKLCLTAAWAQRPEFSVVNIDDEWGVRLARELKDYGQKVITCSQLSEADMTAANINVSLVSGTQFELKTPAGTIRNQFTTCRQTTCLQHVVCSRSRT